MRELPEIETLRSDLEKEVVGKRIKEAEVRPGSNAMKVIRRHGRRKEFQDLLCGAKIENVGRGGRKLVIALDNGHALVVDVGPAARVLKHSSSDPIATHTHVVLSFTTGGHLRIVDPRRAAEIYVAPLNEVWPPESLRDEAVDPLDNMLTWQQFSALLEKRSVTLKELLTDEKFVIGLGDVYSDEILFAAGLRHDRLSNRLTSSDVRRLYRAAGEVMQEALKLRGATLGGDPFVDLHGDRGRFQAELKVFEREGQACRRCRSTIVKEPFEQRHTYLCAQCQS